MPSRKHPAKVYGARALVSKLRQEPDQLKKKLLLLGYLTSRLERKGESVYLVGGQAVETYTAGQFTTGDVDITTTDRKTTEGILAQIGFKSTGMIWLNEALGIAVQIVGRYPTRTEGVRDFEVGPYTVHVVGVENLIVDRLAAAKHWKSARDREAAQALWNIFKDQLDKEYLKKRAREERVQDMLP